MAYLTQKGCGADPPPSNCLFTPENYSGDPGVNVPYKEGCGADALSLARGSWWPPIHPLRQVLTPPRTDKDTRSNYHRVGTSATDSTELHKLTTTSTEVCYWQYTVTCTL